MQPQSNLLGISRRRLLQLAGAGIVVSTIGSQLFNNQPTIATEKASNISSDEALNNLIEGNKRFVNEEKLHPNQTLHHIEASAKGQNPFAVILGCADSRVPPEIVFDQGLSSLFVVRVAGNILDNEILGSIEYALDHLGVPLIMVLGHERCGAVKATVDAVAKGGTVPPHIDSLVKAISPAVLQVKNLSGDLVDQAIRANIKRVVGQLQQSTLVSKFVSANQVKIVGGYYDLDTGIVEQII